jgi:anti-anti-sigma regulatory factor
MTNSELCIKKEGSRIHIQGDLDLYHFKQAKEALKAVYGTNNHDTIIDVSKVTRLDTV